ncbi:MAG: hypothetical protein RIC36_16615 [Rhodospirillales bacterium]
MRTIPEALPCVLLHGAENMLCGLLALIFIKQIQDLAHHVAHRVSTKFLGNRDNFNALFRQFPAIELKLVGVSEKPGEAVNNDYIESSWPKRSLFNHLLKCRALVISR